MYNSLVAVKYSYDASQRSVVDSASTHPVTTICCIILLDIYLNVY